MLLVMISALASRSEVDRHSTSQLFSEIVIQKSVYANIAKSREWSLTTHEIINVIGTMMRVYKSNYNFNSIIEAEHTRDQRDPKAATYLPGLSLPSRVTR